MGIIYLLENAKLWDFSLKGLIQGNHVTLINFRGDRLAWKRENVLTHAHAVIHM